MTDSEYLAYCRRIGSIRLETMERFMIGVQLALVQYTEETQALGQNAQEAMQAALKHPLAGAIAPFASTATRADLERAVCHFEATRKKDLGAIRRMKRLEERLKAHVGESGIVEAGSGETARGQLSLDFEEDE
jgi:hypothetical protein